MKHSISIKPYTEYWLNCFLSLGLSLLTSVEPSYFDYALINKFTYINFGNSIWWRLLEVKFQDEFMNRTAAPLSCRPIEGLNRENLKDTIKKYIDENRIILISTDIYHAITDSIHYHRTHGVHSWVINGYDDETGSFYCLADNIGGYGENEITAENFELSIVPETFSDAVEVLISENIEPYVLTLDDVRENAKTHIKGLTKLSYCNFWMCHSVEYTEDRCFDISKFIGRQHANSLLFRRLYELSYIDEQLMEEMCQVCMELEKNWTSIRGRFMKYYLGGKVPDYEKMSKLVWPVLKKECAMWRRFLELTDNKN